ncbi:hypothetical protein BSG1_11256 [Bacillus sp. SG-1]|nr:hypothetical protein BSG1_11256 [Bacillus sp. SG-1]
MFLKLTYVLNITENLTDYTCFVYARLSIYKFLLFKAVFRLGEGLRMAGGHTPSSS